MKRDAVRAGQRRHALAQRARQPSRLGGATIGRDRGARRIEWQRERPHVARQLALPIGELTLAVVARDLSGLPADVLRVAPRGQARRRGHTVDVRAVQLAQLTRQRRQRPEVGDEVMDGHDHDRRLAVAAKQRGTDRRLPAQIERTMRGPLDLSRQIARAPRRRVGVADPARQGRMHGLPEPFEVERAPQHRMSLRERFERARERGVLEPWRPKRGGNVVRGAVWRELVQDGQRALPFRQPILDRILCRHFRPVRFRAVEHARRQIRQRRFMEKRRIPQCHGERLFDRMAAFDRLERIEAVSAQRLV